MRLRERNDYFQWRGDRYAFHQLVDGPVLARLDPDSEDEQTWTLHSRRVISPTGAEVRDIAKQVQGIDLPERYAVETVVRVRDDGLADRVASLEDRVAALEAKRDKQEQEEMASSWKIEDFGELLVTETPPLPYNDEAEEEDEEATSGSEPVEPIPDPLQGVVDNIIAKQLVTPDVLARLVEPDPQDTARKAALAQRWINLKAQMEDKKLPERDRKLPPITPAEEAEFEHLEAYMSWFK